MESEIEELKGQILILKNKVQVLEGKERKRRAIFWASLLLKIAFIMFTIYGMFKLYDYLMNDVPGVMSKEIKKALYENP